MIDDEPDTIFTRFFYFLKTKPVLITILEAMKAYENAQLFINEEQQASSISRKDLDLFCNHH